MAFNLKNRSFLTLKDFTPAEIGFLLKLAADLKAARYAGTEVPQLLGKEIALIFEKDSTRTRVGFEVAAMIRAPMSPTWGRAAPTWAQGVGQGHRAGAGRMYDAIEYRGYGQAVVEELAEYAGVPSTTADR